VDTREAGRKGGLSRSPRKQAASRANGARARNAVPVVITTQEGGPTVTQAKVSLFIKARE